MILDVYVDETGTIGSDHDDEPFGSGYFIAERTVAAENLRDAIREAFPKPFHMRDIHKRRRVARARRLMGLLPREGHFYGGGLVISPELARSPIYRTLADPGPELRDEIMATPIGPDGLVRPSDIGSVAFFRRRGFGRKRGIWEPSLMLGRLLRLHDCPQPLDVHFHLGVVGRVEDHAQDLNILFRDELERLDRLLTTMRKKGMIRHSVRDVVVGSRNEDEEEDVLLQIADLVAGTASQLMNNTGLGAELYDVVKPLLDRLPGNPPNALRPGIWRLDAPPEVFRV